MTRIGKDKKMFYLEYKCSIEESEITQQKIKILHTEEEIAKVIASGECYDPKFKVINLSSIKPLTDTERIPLYKKHVVKAREEIQRQIRLAAKARKEKEEQERLELDEIERALYEKLKKKYEDEGP